MSRLWIWCTFSAVAMASFSSAMTVPSTKQEIVTFLTNVVPARVEETERQINVTTTQPPFVFDLNALKPIIDVLGKNPQYVIALFTDSVAFAKLVSVILNPGDGNALADFVLYMIPKYGFPNFRKQTNKAWQRDRLHVEDK